MRSLSLTFFLTAAGCFACNPHPTRPSIEDPCPTIADNLAQAGKAAIDFKIQVAKFNAEIAAARARLWKAFPNGPDFPAAEAAFLHALWEKEMYYMMLALPEGITGKAATIPNQMGLVTGDTKDLKGLTKFPTNLDDGIKPYAWPMFVDWVNAIRRADGREKDGMMASLTLLATAIQDKSNYRKAYEDARNWSEFMSSGLDVSKYVTPQVYLVRQMESDVSFVLGRSKPADLPDVQAATLDLYNLFVKSFGEKEVLAAGGTVLRTPKNSVGGLAKRADVEIGTYIASPSPNPFMLFLTLASNSTPRSYAIALMMDQYGLLGGKATETFNTRGKWADALSAYNQLVARFGEPTVLSAAARLKAAPKNPLGGIRGDPQMKPVLHWFQAMLVDPKTVIPDGQVPHFKAGSYDSRWLGKIVEVRGVVSRVDLAKGSFPPYATIYFKESRPDGITGFSPNSEMLQSKYGESFAGLIGKTIEISGEVNKWREGGGVRILDLSQVKVLDAAVAAADFRESRPDWLTAPKPVEVLVDSPKYLAWKKFPAGAKATYETRLLYEHSAGSDQYTRTRISRFTFRLDSIDDKRAVVMATGSTVWHRTGGETHSPDQKFVYQAKEPPAVSPPDPSFETKTGEETLVISGKKIATKWESVSKTSDPMTFTKTWRSDEVPGGLVLEHRQEHTAIVGGTYRSINETIYAPVEGAEPELSKENSSGDAPAGYIAQPPPPGRAAPTPTPAPATTSQPQPNAAPPTPAPAPVRAAPPAVRTRPQYPSNLPPAVARQVEFSRRYQLVMVRAGRARAGLSQFQRRQAASGGELPAGVRAAADRLDPQLRAVQTAIRPGDFSAAEQNLQTAEDTLVVIEEFLAKR